MKSLTLYIDDIVHQEFKIRCAQEKTTMTKKIENLLKKELGEKNE